MGEENHNAAVIPASFRGLRVLLVDKDTSFLFNTAKEMRSFSYKVTTVELATVALSILQERKDSFDLVMADVNMGESDCFKFVESVRLIKDLPIIVMSTELEKDMVKEGMMKGACFFLRKPISSKNLKNVWQHVLRQRKYMTKNAGASEQEEGNKGVEREESDDHCQKKARGNCKKRAMDDEGRGDFKRKK